MRPVPRVNKSMAIMMLNLDELAMIFIKAIRAINGIQIMLNWTQIFKPSKNPEPISVWSR